MITRDRFNIARDVSLGHYTHEKSPLGSIAALATIDYIETEKLLEKVSANGEWMSIELSRLKDRFPLIGDVRGIGLLWGIELVKDRTTKERAIKEAEMVMYDCLRNGLNFKVSHGNVIQLSPALTISHEELSLAISILENALEKIS
jgi:4-aminobutyrate aminotransferase